MPIAAHFSNLIEILTSFGNSGLQVVQNGSLMEPVDAFEYYQRAFFHFEHYKGRADEFTNIPVDVQTFVEHEDYLGKRGVTWPAVLEAMIELNRPARYVEAVLTGGIGTAKTHLAIYTQCYQVYVLSCMKNPHEQFGLDPSSEIVVIFQSITEALAKAIDYQRFKDIVSQSVYFNQSFPFDPTIESELRFPKRIIVKPIAGHDTAALGHNVISGLIDELNFMSVIQDSKNTHDGTDYDQAVTNYQTIVRRRESRFMSQGQLSGMLCLVSSKRYPGQFTDRKMEQAAKDIAKNGSSNIFVYDKRLWDVKPPEAFSGATFKVFIGQRHRNPFILKPSEYEEWEEDDPDIDTIPEEFRHSYEEDIHSALRDISGISSQMQHAYFTDVKLLSQAFGKHKNIFNVPRSDFTTPPLAVLPGLFIEPEKPRYAHVDLGATADSAGICIGHVDEFIKIERTKGAFEELPVIVIDGILEVPPPPGGEIDFARIRSIFYRLVELGLNLRWISYDSWQSRDSLQLLHREGFTVGTLSMDKDTKAYDWTKQAIAHGRLICPSHDKCEEELRMLQWFRDKDKIDHLPDGSKDCADALAGVVFGLTMRREIWIDAGVETPEIKIEEKPKGLEIL